MLARSSLVVLALLTAGCLKDLTGVQMATDGTSSDPTTDTNPSEPTSTTSDMPTCGNSNLEPGEQCDDGNAVAGDGCENNCTTTPSENCGNSVVDDDEECDDGNKTNGDGCENNCKKTMQSASCGDGTPNPGEECDDGNMDDTDACTNNCKKAYCGDGFAQVDVEQCDDGEPTATCDGDCTEPQCGDGLINAAAGEECDDDNSDESDACISCKMAVCGDSFVQAGVEECDDGNQTDDDDCSNGCMAPRKVFVTYEDFKGNLGGVLVADAKCAQAAAGALLPESVEWLAWISDDTLSPASAGRLDTTFTGYYKLTNGTVIAHGWSDLTDGSLLQPINIDETGAPLEEEPFAVWSNTTPTGLSAGNDDCTGWSSAALATKARYGDVNAMDGGWSDAPMDNPIGCSNSLHLYCFQNSPLP